MAIFGPSKEEYEKLQQENEKLRGEIRSLKADANELEGYRRDIRDNKPVIPFRANMEGVFDKTKYVMIPRVNYESMSQYLRSSYDDAEALEKERELRYKAVKEANDYKNQYNDLKSSMDNYIITQSQTVIEEKVEEIVSSRTVELNNKIAAHNIAVQNFANEKEKLAKETKAMQEEARKEKQTAKAVKDKYTQELESQKQKADALVSREASLEAREAAVADFDSKAEEKIGRKLKARTEALDAREQQLREREKNLDKEIKRTLQDRTEALAAREAELEGKLAMANNMYRISRERANAARGIRPKGQHDGYVVTHWNKYTEHLNFVKSDALGRMVTDYLNIWYPDYNQAKFGRNVHLTCIAWKMVIQSPLDVCYPRSDVMDELQSHLKIVMNECGICKIANADFVPDQETLAYELAKEKEAYVYKWDVQPNVKAGLWEIVLYTNKEPRIPPGRIYINYRKS